jgi:hypothetical protein
MGGSLMRRRWKQTVIALLPAALAAAAFAWPYDNSEARRTLAELGRQIEPPLAASTDLQQSPVLVGPSIEISVRALHNCITDTTGCIIAERSGGDPVVGLLKYEKLRPFLDSFLDADKSTAICVISSWTGRVGEKGSIAATHKGIKIDVVPELWDENTLILGSSD